MITTISSDELNEKRIARYNARQGELDGYDCPKCCNKGDYMYLKDGVIYTAQCECLKVRENIEKLKCSGLHKLSKTKTFESYSDTETWQTNLKESVLKFAQKPDGAWLFLGGQSGAGKTHLCTAAVHEFTKQGKSAKYMLWRDDSALLKGSVNEGQGYKLLMDEYKRPDVLYIDDLFKMKKGEQPTTGDINVAFEIINFRYYNPDAITIITTELSMSDILRIDQALGSRIVERCSGNNHFISYDPEKNYRLHKIL